jgi:hypothetical protein
MSSPDETRSRIARDLRPVRPLWPPSRRALVLLPIALVTIVAVPALHFFRSDFAELGFLRAWGLSFVEAAGGLAVVALALQESIPGRALSLPAIVATFVAGLVTPFVILSVTAKSYAIGAPPGLEWSDGVTCFRVSLSSAVPALLAAAFLAARAFPLRPGLAGALYGLGCGLIADAGMRLFCEFTVPSHVITAHGGAIVAAIAGGCVLAQVVGRR